MTLAEERPTEAEQTGSKPDLFDRIRDTPVGRTIWRSPRRVTPRDRAAAHWSSFAMHIYPVKMKREQIAFKYSWYL